MSNLTARDLIDLARMMIKEAQLLKAEGQLACAQALAQRAIAMDQEGWRRLAVA